MKKQTLRIAAVFSAAFFLTSALQAETKDAASTVQSAASEKKSDRPAPPDDGRKTAEDYLSMPEYSKLAEFLTGWLKNDLELQKNTLNAQSKALTLKSTQINNGIDVQLSSGNVSITTDTASNTKISVSPSVTVDVPMVSDGSFSASVPYTIDNEKDEKYVSNGSISATVGIISSSAKQRKVTLLEAERALTEANRAVQDRALNAEKEFYTALKKLYNYAIAIHSAKDDLYDDQLDLRVLETQGYSKTSAKYRQAYLKVESDSRTVQEQQRIFERETAVFAMNCGMEFNRTSNEQDEKSESGQKDAAYDPVAAGETAYEAAMAFLPDAIPAVKDERIFDYDASTYSKTESAKWDQYIGGLKREADGDFSLKATAEYKLNSTTSGYDDAGGKLSLGWKGLTASAGAYVPTKSNLFNQKSTADKNDNPYFQFGISIDPNQWRLAKLNDQQDEIDSKLEEIAVQDAADDYETDMLSKVSSFHDIKWSERSYAEEYDMYTQLTADEEKWLKQGIVTESDYLDAKNNMEKAKINIMINAIDLIVYNDEVKLLFHNDGEKETK